MREILFRGKSMNAEAWVYGDLHQPYGVNSIIDIIRNGYEDKENVLPKTIGQYTGVQDRNGVKIFEGDIVKAEDEMVGMVYWHKEHASFYWGYGFTFVHNDELEVIGNIHDNPERLEELE